MSKRSLTNRRKRGTETSSFGVPGRVNDDSSKFYKSRLYEQLNGERKIEEFSGNQIKEHFLNKIFCKSSEHMEELPDYSVHLMVTSPPYNVGKGL